MHALSAQLSWTHLRQIIALDDPLRREYYVEMCRLERWSTRQLQDRIESQLFERLVAIELKTGHLKAEHKGQMELYLRWLAKNEQEEGEAVVV